MPFEGIFYGFVLDLADQHFEHEVVLACEALVLPELRAYIEMDCGPG